MISIYQLKPRFQALLLPIDPEQSEELEEGRKEVEEELG